MLGSPTFVSVISLCLAAKEIDKMSSSFNVANLSLIMTFTSTIMGITITALCQKRDNLNKQILHCRSDLSIICPSVLV